MTTATARTVGGDCPGCDSVTDVSSRRSVRDRPAALRGRELSAELRGDPQHPQADGRRRRRHGGRDRDGRGETRGSESFTRARGLRL